MNLAYKLKIWMTSGIFIEPPFNKIGNCGEHPRHQLLLCALLRWRFCRHLHGARHEVRHGKSKHAQVMANLGVSVLTVSHYNILLVVTECHRNPRARPKVKVKGVFGAFFYLWEGRENLNVPKKS